MDKRSHPRIMKYLQVEMSDAISSMPGSSVDVSPNGMRVRLHQNRRLSPNQPISLLVTDHGKPYRLDGRVCWYQRRIIDNSRYVGVRFDRTNPYFCRDVLRLEIGGSGLPYQYEFKDYQIFLDEYLNHIIFGDLFIRHNGRPPRLGREFHVELNVREKNRPFKLCGEVVHHGSEGFTLKLKDFEQAKQRLNDWMHG